ncbi:MAG TPA: ABC transporter ATP-binding protein [Eoetvoesiella sp.]|uniref:ABC transporter ATP-binding protein n=1 Tax=Eoetvoesiella sp. TaxID=1966355 RepID=UPI002CA35B58|nr:ABC transporter ATP-binding protein [Eoetvoesiella sp.]HWK60234.1 ABC transporter ATP-binding protein [Eoetvoesiella sp.]
MLKVGNLVAGYQTGSRVLDGFSLHIEPGEVVALLGRNGMGKTTFLKALMGHVPVSEGSINFADEEVAGRKPYEMARRGVGYVPQGREIFSDFTVEENLLMGLLGRPDLPQKVPDWAFEVFPVLHERRKQRGGSMSGGQQQQLAIVRALVGQPRLLLLDEPSEGIQPNIVEEIGKVLARIAREQGLTILLVEQNMELVLGMAQRCLFMENGAIAYETSEVQQLRTDPSPIHRYLSV